MGEASLNKQLETLHVLTLYMVFPPTLTVLTHYKPSTSLCTVTMIRINLKLANQTIW